MVVGLGLYFGGWGLRLWVVMTVVVVIVVIVAVVEWISRLVGCGGCWLMKFFIFFSLVVTDNGLS